MSGTAGKDRARAATALLAALVGVGLAGFLAGGVVAEEETDVSEGLGYAAAFVLAGLVMTSFMWWSARRRAAKFGLSTSRFLRVARQVQRGAMPADPAERPAAIDVATRQRRTLNLQQSRWVWWVMGAVALLWLVNAVLQVLDHNYLYACVNVLLIGIFLIYRPAMRRQRRRLDSVEQALAPLDPRRAGPTPR